MSRVRNLIALIPVVILSGCLEYNEDITVNSDKTGRIQMDIAVLADFFDKEQIEEIREELKEAQEEFRKHPQITHADFAVKLKSDMYHFMYDIGVKDYKFLEDLTADQLSSSGTLGFNSLDNSGIYFETLENGNIIFHRTLGTDSQQVVRSRMTKLGLKSRVNSWMTKLRSKIKGKKSNEDDPFEGRFATYRFHGPKIIKASEPGQLSRRSVEWKFPIEFNGVSQKSDLQAEFSLNGTTWWMIAAALAVFASGLFWFKSFWARGGLRRLARGTGAM